MQNVFQEVILILAINIYISTHTIEHFNVGDKSISISYPFIILFILYDCHCLLLNWIVLWLLWHSRILNSDSEIETKILSYEM